MVFDGVPQADDTLSPVVSAECTTNRPSPNLKALVPEKILTSPYDSFYFPELKELSFQQLASCIGLLQGFISSFVFENATPFIHHSLHPDLPDAFQDCLAICSLYMNKTAANHDLVFKMLDGKLKALISSSVHIVRPKEALLAVQALLMYQLIRLFDGDETQRLNAERDLGLLESWTLRLQQGLFEAQLDTQNHWQNQWVLLESIRRTIMMSVVLRAFSALLKTGSCDLVPLLSILPVSNGGWKESELITYAAFVDEWNAGRVETLGTYERLLLEVCCHAKPVNR